MHLFLTFIYQKYCLKIKIKYLEITPHMILKLKDILKSTLYIPVYQKFQMDARQRARHIKHE